MEIPRFWRNKDEYLKLIGEKCPHCEVKIFPPRDICTQCGGNTVNPSKTEVLNPGKLVGVTIITEGKTNNVEVIPIAIVKLESGHEITTKLLTDPRNIYPNSELKVISTAENGSPHNRKLTSIPVYSARQ